MANAALGHLDEEAIDHGDAEHATNKHLVDAYSGCHLAVRGSAFERDVLGNVVMVDEVEVGQVTELHLGGAMISYEFLCGRVYFMLAFSEDSHSPCSINRTADPVGLAQDVLGLVPC